MSERILTVTEAARGFADLINRIYYRNESALLVRNGTPVARIVPVRPPRLTGAELADWWERRPVLAPEDADAFADDVEAARRDAHAARDPWA
jgi:antitoxin (DNA-binding transcriptional repressor) of toxin-antitoxin stability system